MSPQPYVSLTFDQQQALERAFFDACDSLCQCLAYGLLLGWGMQSVPVKVGLVTESMPGITMTFPPQEPGADGPNGKIRHINFAVGRDAPNVPMLFGVVGGHAHNIIMEWGSKEDGGDISEYVTRAHDRAKAREENRKRILIPSKS